MGEQMGNPLEWPHEKRCKECGRVFVVRDVDTWCYANRSGASIRFFCSWHCLRQNQKKHEVVVKKVDKAQQKKAMKFARLKPWQKEIMIRNMMRSGKDLNGIREETGLSYQHVSYYMRKIRKEEQHGARDLDHDAGQGDREELQGLPAAGSGQPAGKDGHE